MFFRAQYGALRVKYGTTGGKMHRLSGKQHHFGGAARAKESFSGQHFWRSNDVISGQTNLWKSGALPKHQQYSHVRLNDIIRGGNAANLVH